MEPEEFNEHHVKEYTSWKNPQLPNAPGMGLTVWGTTFSSSIGGGSKIRVFMLRGAAGKCDKIHHDGTASVTFTRGVQIVPYHNDKRPKAPTHWNWKDQCNFPRIDICKLGSPGALRMVKEEYPEMVEIPQ